VNANQLHVLPLLPQEVNLLAPPPPPPLSDHVISAQLIEEGPALDYAGATPSDVSSSVVPQSPVNGESQPNPVAVVGGQVEQRVEYEQEEDYNNSSAIESLAMTFGEKVSGVAGAASITYARQIPAPFFVQ
jgi:hypothetical protein